VHARLSFLDGSPDEVGGSVTSFRDQVVPLVREHGGTAAILLVDRETGKEVALTLWESLDAMRASEEAADALRERAAEQVHATTPPRVERYQVEVFETF
jgi:hypothetical protein